MRHIAVITFVACLTALAGCGGGGVQGVTSSDKFVAATPFKALPEEAAGTLVTGIGVSEQRSNITLARDAAITSAQADLARKIESKVEAVWKRTMADWTEHKAASPAVSNEAMSVEEMKTMQKTIVDTKLTGPWDIQEIVDKDTGRYWVRILLAGSTVDKWITQRMNTEGLLRKFVIESQVKKVQDDLQKELDTLAAREKEERAQVTRIAGQ